MVVEAQRLPVESLAWAAGEVAASTDLRSALGAIAGAAAEATGADVAVVRVLDPEGHLVARALAPAGSSLGAEIAGTRTTCEVIAAGEVPEATRRAADRARAAGVLVLPARDDARIVGSVELVRVADEFAADERAAAALAATLVALAVRTLGTDGAGAGSRAKWLELAGDALAAGGEPHRAAQQAVRLAVETTGARSGSLWRVGQETQELIASLGPVEAGLDRAAQLVAEAGAGPEPAASGHAPGPPRRAPHR